MEHEIRSKINLKNNSRKNNQSIQAKESTNERTKTKNIKSTKKVNEITSNAGSSTANKSANIQQQACKGANTQGLWPKNTVLIAGDSMLSNINENTLSQRYHTNVRCFKGSTIADLHDYLKPLVKKKPEKIILMVGTNDLVNLSITEMVKGMKSLCNWILSIIPSCRSSSRKLQGMMIRSS